MKFKARSSFPCKVKSLPTVTLRAASSLTSSCEPLTLTDIKAADDSSLSCQSGVVQRVNSLTVKVQRYTDCRPDPKTSSSTVDYEFNLFHSKLRRKLVKEICLCVFVAVVWLSVCNCLC